MHTPFPPSVMFVAYCDDRPQSTMNKYKLTRLSTYDDISSVLHVLVKDMDLVHRHACLLAHHMPRKRRSCNDWKVQSMADTAQRYEKKRKKGVHIQMNGEKPKEKK